MIFIFRNGRLRAQTAYWIYMGVLAFSEALIFTVLTVYYVQKAGLNPLQLVLIGTVLESTVFLCEVPTGVLADTYSRKLSVIIGTGLFGVAYLLEGSVTAFAFILLAEMIRGVGCTFTSGALDAWIADEVGAEHVGPVYIRGAQVAQAAGVVGLALSALLAWWHLSLPILLGGGLGVALGFFLITAMPEIGFQPAPREERNSWRQLGATLGGGLRLVRTRTILMIFLVISAVFGMSSEGYDRLWENHFLNTLHFPALGGLAPVVWIGLIHAGSLLLSMLTTEFVRRKVDPNDRRLVSRVLVATTALQVAGMVAFGLAGGFGAGLTAAWAVSVFRTVAGPLQNTWLVQSLDSRVRATVLSLHSQANALGQVAGGPVIGAIGTLRTLRAALVAAGVVLLPSLPLFARAGRQSEADDALVLEAGEG